MRRRNRRTLVFHTLLGLTALFAACDERSPDVGPAAGGPSGGTAAATAEKGGQEEFGPYEVVDNWPQPLPDGPDGIKHEGWTWGSVGAVFAETPDRIWIAQRGELPLPPGAKPWTPYRHAEPAAGVQRQHRRAVRDM